MQNKSNAVFPENQASQSRISPERILAIVERLEATADSILRGIGRRTVVISVFPHNRLNESYRHKNELALIEYGKLMATASYLRDKFNLRRKEDKRQETTVSIAA